MQCPECGSSATPVFNTRTVKGTGSRWRRRECHKCGHKFSTVEVHQPLFRAMEKALTIVSHAYSGLKALNKHSPGLLQQNKRTNEAE